MVLLDSTAPASPASSTATPARDGGSYDLGGRVATLVSTTARLSLGGLVGVPTASHLRSTIDEYAQTGSSTEAAAALRDFGDKPLVVLTAGSESSADWFADQDALATLSTNTHHRVIEGIAHQGLIVDEEGAAAATRAILEVVSSIRTALPLDR